MHSARYTQPKQNKEKKKQELDPLCFKQLTILDWTSNSNSINLWSNYKESLTWLQLFSSTAKCDSQSPQKLYIILLQEKLINSASKASRKSPKVTSCHSLTDQQVALDYQSQIMTDTVNQKIIAPLSHDWASFCKSLNKSENPCTQLTLLHKWSFPTLSVFFTDGSEWTGATRNMMWAQC